MKRRLLVGVLLIGLSAVGVRLQAAFSVPLTIQEALYPGSVAGVTRTADPVTAGIPLPDDPVTGVSDVSQLTLTGASLGQFRVLARWPSGRIKWVLVDTQASLSAGGTATGIALAAGGTGNFGGPDLATDNGASITIATGAATFTIRKANFNGFDQVVVGGTTVVAAGTSSGLVITGPTPGNTTCGTCTTVYSSANDPSSMAVIEENGPVRAVVRVAGAHKDASGNSYMNFTVRLHFYKGLARVKAVTTLRNADLGDSNTFATAYKGLAAYEWRTTANISGTRTYAIGKHAGAVETGTMSGSDDVYLYQAESLSMKEPDWCGSGCVAYTTDTGYDLRKNGVSLATGTDDAAQAAGGWADISNTSGAGMSIGVYQMAAYWPKALEFASGGSEVRIGIWPRQNSRTYHQAWPQWSTHDLYFDFHGTALPSPAGEFLKFQHYLVARAPYSHYNATTVFAPYPMVDPAVEQAFYQSTGAAGVPTLNSSNMWPYLDKGIRDTANWNLPVWRFKSWGAPGGGNQIEFHWSNFMNWITRGMTGRYLDSMHYYRFLTDDVFPHSDGFNWRDQTGLDAQGFPVRTSANSTLAFRTWIDISHPHWYGMGDYYFLTGDELAKEQLLDGVKDYYTTSGTYAQTGKLATSRAVGLHLVGAARYAAFLKSIGDTTTATTVLDNATALYNLEVASQLCPVSDQSYAACTTSLNPAVYNENTTPGTSRLRGIHWAYGFLSNMCGASVVDRMHGSFMAAMLVQGILEFRAQKGAAWTDYWNALDLAYGISQASLTETYKDNGTGRWDDSGFRAYDLVDSASSCPSAPDDSNYEVNARATEWQHFYAQYLVTGSAAGWSSKFTTTTQKLMGALSVYWQENGSYQVSQLIDIVKNPGTATLQPVSVTNVVNNGSGTYTISWVVPSGTQSYRIKWAPRRIVDWIGFNPDRYTFIGDPATTTNWFAAANVPVLPAPAAAGTTQSLTISTGNSGLTAGNFSVKAYVAGAGAPPPLPVSGANLVLVSGNYQAGTVGTALNAPFTVKVTDGSGSAVSGVTVAFAVTAGGGSLSSALVSTSSSGLASTTLTLGSFAGVNTVTVTAGTLAGSPLTFSATALSTGVVVLNPNHWQNMTPTYQGAPAGGQLTPFTFNNMGVYDPASQRTISFERWFDSIRGMSIYANALVAYDPARNTATVLKVNNWTRGSTTTDPLPANSADPTPIDRHPLGGLALDSNAGTVYLVNGANQTGHLYYPDHPNDTWRFQLTSGSWTKVADAAVDVHPPSDVGTYSGMIYDPPLGKLVYFVSGSSTTTWLFDPGTNRWSALPVDPTAASVHISTAGIAYDSRRDLVVAYGGGTTSGSDPSSQLWAYSVSQNRWTALPAAPIPAAAAEFAYDSNHDVFLALVGQSTLIYNPRTSTWLYLAATINRGTELSRQNVTYNPAQDVFVFQGGTWDTPVWSLFRFDDAASPALKITPPQNLRIVR